MLSYVLAGLVSAGKMIILTISIIGILVFAFWPITAPRLGTKYPVLGAVVALVGFVWWRYTVRNEGKGLDI